jgi:hypothetical protein
VLFVISNAEVHLLLGALENEKAAEILKFEPSFARYLSAAAAQIMKIVLSDDTLDCDR